MVKQVIHLIIRVPKSEAAFTYFQLEANEGLCFYSTLDNSLGEPFRDIEIFAPECFETELRHLLDTLAKQYPIDILKDKKLEDSRGLAGSIEGKN